MSIGAFSTVNAGDLSLLIRALESRRLVEPYSSLQLSRIVSTSIAVPIQQGLEQLCEQGFNETQIAHTLKLLVADRSTRQIDEALFECVTSGPEAPGITNRDTAVVVRELFSHAEKSVMVVGFAVYQGRQVFESLAHRMDANPDLDVQLYLNIPRGYRDTTLSQILVAQFVNNFKTKEWPKESRLPKVFYDPRSLAEEHSKRSSLHAKCVVVDERHIFISSANFTEAAQERNIEVGLKVESEKLAKQLLGHFDQLLNHGAVKQAI